MDGITDSMGMSLSNSRRQRRTEEPGVLQSVGHRVRHDLETEQQQCKETQMYGYSTDWQNVNGDPDHPVLIFTINKELKTTIISNT